jgi:hypothetical protein
MRDFSTKQVEKVLLRKRCPFSGVDEKSRCHEIERTSNARRALREAKRFPVIRVVNHITFVVLAFVDREIAPG